MKIHGKRVLIVFGCLELGGAERQGLLLGRYLKETHGCLVEVWGFHSPGAIAALCEEAGIPWKIVPMPFSGTRLQGWWRFLQFIRLLRDLRPAFLLPYTSVPNISCGLTWRLGGAGTCVWNQRDEGLERLRPAMEQAAVRLTPVFVANSRAGADFLKQGLRVPPEKIRVVRNGIELPAAALGAAAWRQRLGVDAKCFLACMLANFSAFKDHRTLLKAWALALRGLAAKGREAKLVLAGTGSGPQEEMRQLALRLGIEDSVLFPGRVDDVSGLLRTVDLGVLSSRSEGCPNAVLECMAAGLPLVGTDTAGIRDALGPAASRFLVRAGDEADLARAILDFAEDPELRSRAGAANRRRAAEDYSPVRMCREMLEVLAGPGDESRTIACP